MDVHDNLRKRLQSFTVNEKGCHEWTKAVSKTGYGVFGIGSRLDNSRKTVYAHRISWELLNQEPIPKGLHVLHRCDNPKCINVDHLFIGTAKDNMQDMHAKDRAAMKKGVIPSNFRRQIDLVKSGKFSKLNIENVINIKKSLTEGVDYREIAIEYNVSRQCISDIKRKATWINV